MSRSVIVTISVAVLCVFCIWAPVAVKGGAQQMRARYGPVVSAYLTGLSEELNELEYQLRNHEIGQPDYERARQRLTIMRRYVERLAAKSGEDSVPELQVLAADELDELGLGERPNPDRLRVGDLPGGQWRLIGIERGRARYFVFNRLPLSEEAFTKGPEGSEGSIPDSNLAGVAVGRPGRRYDPQSVIETIVVRDRQASSQAPPAQPDPASDHGGGGAAPEAGDRPVSASSGPGKMAQPEPQFQPLQILRIYLPEYTDKARNRGVWGDLIVRALFQGDGKIKNVEVERRLGFGLDKRAVDSVKRTEFQPAQVGGRPVDASVQIVFNFKFGRVAFYVMMMEPQDEAK